MATVQITNVSPLGELEVPILGRVVGRGETVDVDSEIAGKVPDTNVEGDTGSGLLAQVGTWAPASSPFKKSASTTPADTTPPVTPEGE